MPISIKRLSCPLQLVEMLDMSVPAVAKLRRLLDSLPREALPDILTSIIRTSNKEKLQVASSPSVLSCFVAFRLALDSE